MRYLRLASAVLVGSTLALFAPGCGGSKSDEETPVAAEGEAPPAEEVASTEPVPPPAPAAGATAGAPAAKPAGNSGATDELLQLAQTTPASTTGAAPGAAPEAASGPAPVTGMGQMGPPAGYPGMGGSGGMGQGGPPPGFARMAQGQPPGGPGGGPQTGMGQSGPPAGYPGMSGSGGPPGGMGQAGPPAGYPGMGGQGQGRPGGPSSAYPGMSMPGMQRPGGPGESLAAGPVGGSLGGSGTLAEADFSDPVKGAESFLSAVQAKDPERLADAVALRSPTEAVAKHQALFQSLLERNADPSHLDDLATIFEGMKVVDRNNIRSTGSQGIILAKTEEDGDTITRTLQMRREKAGWKVKDFSNPRIIPGNPLYKQQQRQNKSGGGRGSYSGGGL